jgi:Na+/H+ antiporter NhaD/arsenite permease-like protein
MFVVIVVDPQKNKLNLCCSSVLGVVVSLFFLENFISAYVHLPLAWIAVLGSLTLMVLADVEDMEVILHKVCLIVVFVAFNLAM